MYVDRVCGVAKEPYAITHVRMYEFTCPLPVLWHRGRFELTPGFVPALNGPTTGSEARVLGGIVYNRV